MKKEIAWKTTQVVSYFKCEKNRNTKKLTFNTQHEIIFLAILNLLSLMLRLIRT